MSRSFKQSRYDSRRTTASRSNRTTIGYWIPLAVTVTLAAGGLAAWVWSAREDHESTDTTTSDDEDLSYGEEARPGGRDDGRKPPSYGVSEGVVPGIPTGAGDAGDIGVDGGFVDSIGRGAREFIRRTPSPQQAFDSVKKMGVAGVVAAGAVVGRGLSAIREEGSERSHSERRVNEEGFSDHERWSEEAEKIHTTEESSRSAVVAGSSKLPAGSRKKTVAVVVSAEVMLENLRDEDSGKYHSEHASLLSTLPHIDANTTTLLILIYNPTHTSHSQPRAPSSMGSSYAGINTPGQTPGEELTSMDPSPYTPPGTTPALSARSSGGDFYDLLHKQAVTLVANPVSVMPFSTPAGWVHMLKHLAPDVVYVVDSLTGEKGENVEAVKGWVGQLVIVAGGDGTGLGGLVDTEDEGDGNDAPKRGSARWWVDSGMVGLGKGVEVVDGGKVTEDWERRVSGRD